MCQPACTSCPAGQRGFRIAHRFLREREPPDSGFDSQGAAVCCKPGLGDHRPNSPLICISSCKGARVPSALKQCSRYRPHPQQQRVMAYVACVSSGAASAEQGASALGCLEARTSPPPPVSTGIPRLLITVLQMSRFSARTASDTPWREILKVIDGGLLRVAGRAL
jgi:hypothetical protein